MLLVSNWIVVGFIILSKPEIEISPAEPDEAVKALKIQEAESLIEWEKTNIKAEQVDLQTAQVVVEYRRSYLDNLKELRAKGAISERIVSDAERDYQLALVDEKAELVDIEIAQKKLNLAIIRKKLAEENSFSEGFIQNNRIRKVR